MSVPLSSPSAVIMTAALSSNDTLTPFNLLIGYFCLIITAPCTCFLNSAGPFFTTTLQKSPTAAAGNLDNLVWYL